MELQTRVARELHAHWKQYYQPCDIAAIQEVCAEPKYVPNYALILSRTLGESSRNFSRAKSQVTADGSVFCIGDVCRSCNYLSSIEALTNSDVANFNYRWEEQFAVQRNQIILENRMTHLALGRNLIDQQQASTKLAAEIATRVGAMAGKAAQNWATLGSYLLSERGQKQADDTIRLFKRGFGVNEQERTPDSGYSTSRTAETVRYDEQRTGDTPPIIPWGTMPGAVTVFNPDPAANPPASGSMDPFNQSGDWWKATPAPETQER